MDDYIILDNPDSIPELSENTNYESEIPLIFQGIAGTRSLTISEQSL